PGHIQAAFGGQLFAPLGNQGGDVGPYLVSDLHHLRRGGHFEIEHRLTDAAQKLEISVLDVAPVLAKVNGDLPGSAQLGEDCCRHRIRIADAPRLPQGRDVIDVDPQPLHARVSIRTSGPGHRLSERVTTSAISWAYSSFRGRSGPSTRILTFGS